MDEALKIMNDKHKHQEDLEAAKGWLAIAKENDNKIAIQILENLFPELKESEDEKIIKYIIWHLKHTRMYLDNSINNHVEEAIDWLKSLKDRVQPQPKQEWSEYDKIQLSEAIQMIEANGTWIRSEDAVKKVSNWLKSIKPNHWKPSEQNIKDLEWCADLVQDKLGVGFHRLQVFIDEIKNL